MSIIVNNTDNQLNINTNGVLDVYAVRSIKSVSKGVDASGNYYIAINFIANDKNNSLRIYLKDVSSPVSWTNDLAGANAALADIRDWLSEIIEVEISEANDSILVYGFDGVNNQPVSVDSNGQVNTNVHDGSGNALTSTVIGADTGLDVNIIGGVTLEVNLDQNNDQVQVYGSDLTNPIKTNTSGVLAIQDNGGSITVDALNLDIRDLTHLVDTVKIYGSNNANPVATDIAGNVGIQDGGNSITVDGGTGLARTPNMLRPTTSGTLSTTMYSISVANVGAANGTVLSGTTIKPGEVINFSADAINNYFSSFAYNATGTEFIIIYVS